MVRTQLYLPENVYKKIKIEAKKKGMSFAGYVRIKLEVDAEKNSSVSDEDLEKFPILRLAGMFHFSGIKTNEDIDKALYCGPNGPL